MDNKKKNELEVYYKKKGDYNKKIQQLLRNCCQKKK